MKPKIRQRQIRMYTCKGYGETGHGSTAWQAYIQWRRFSFQPKIISLMECKDCFGFGEKLIPNGFYSKTVTCKVCKGLGCVVPEKTTINSSKYSSVDMFKFSLGLILGTILTTGLMYLIIS